MLMEKGEDLPVSAFCPAGNPRNSGHGLPCLALHEASLQDLSPPNFAASEEDNFLTEVGL